MPEQLDLALMVEQVDETLAPMKDPNPVLLAILALMAERADVVYVQRIASTSLSGHRIVCPLDSGELDYASNDRIDHINRALWLTTSAYVLNELASVVAYGRVEEPTWNWLPGQPLFLGDNGMITQTPPDETNAAFLRQVGTAITPTSIFFDLGPPIFLAALGGYAGGYAGGYYGTALGGYDGGYAVGY